MGFRRYPEYYPYCWDWEWFTPWFACFAHRSSTGWLHVAFGTPWGMLYELNVRRHPG